MTNKQKFILKDFQNMLNVINFECENSDSFNEELNNIGLKSNIKNDINKVSDLLKKENN